MIEAHVSGFCSLHTAPVLASDLIQGVSDLAQRAVFDRLYQLGKEVAIIDRYLLQLSEGLIRSSTMALLEVIE